MLKVFSGKREKEKEKKEEKERKRTTNSTSSRKNRKSLRISIKVLASHLQTVETHNKELAPTAALADLDDSSNDLNNSSAHIRANSTDGGPTTPRRTLVNTLHSKTMVAPLKGKVTPQTPTQAATHAPPPPPPKELKPTSRLSVIRMAIAEGSITLDEPSPHHRSPSSPGGAFMDPNPKLHLDGETSQSKSHKRRSLHIDDYSTYAIRQEQNKNAHEESSKQNRKRGNTTFKPTVSPTSPTALGFKPQEVFNTRVHSRSPSKTTDHYMEALKTVNRLSTGSTGSDKKISPIHLLKAEDYHSKRMSSESLAATDIDDLASMGSFTNNSTRNALDENEISEAFDINEIESEGESDNEGEPDDSTPMPSNNSFANPFAGSTVMLKKYGSHAKVDEKGLPKRLHDLIEQGNTELFMFLLNKFLGQYLDKYRNQLLSFPQPPNNLQDLVSQKQVEVLNEQFLDATCNMCTLLHKAARHNRTNIMQFLLDKGASVHTTDTLLATPLFYSTAHGHAKACIHLLNKGAQVNIKDRYENSPFILALKNSHFHVANTLKLFGADVNFKGKRGNTVLHFAAEEGDLDKVKFVTEVLGCQVYHQNRNSETVFFLALEFPSVLQYLVAHIFKNFEEKQALKWVQVIDFQGRNLIHRCAEKGHVKSFFNLVALLPERTVREMINQKDKMVGSTPLHVALMNNQTEFIRILVLSDEVDVNCQNNKGDTPLHLALRNSNLFAVSLFMNSGIASKTIKNAQGQTPKAIAKKQGIDLKQVNNSISVYENGKRKSIAPFKEEQEEALKITKNPWFVNEQLLIQKMAKLELFAPSDHISTSISLTATIASTPSPSPSPKSPRKLASDDFLCYDQFVLGVATMDEHHRHLLDMVNALYKYAVLQTETWVLGLILGSLSVYAETAHRDEELLMQKYESLFTKEMLAHHVKEHLEFSMKIQDFQRRFVSKHDYLEIELLEYLTTWIKEHLVKADGELAQAIPKSLNWH